MDSSSPEYPFRPSRHKPRGSPSSESLCTSLGQSCRKETEVFFSGTSHMLHQKCLLTLPQRWYGCISRERGRMGWDREPQSACAWGSQEGLNPALYMDHCILTFVLNVHRCGFLGNGSSWGRDLSVFKCIYCLIKQSVLQPNRAILSGKETVALLLSGQ